MNINKKIKERALILCGHGSRSSSYEKDFLILKKKIKKKIKDTDVLHCFIEINYPSLDSCINENIKKYKKIFIFPLLLFEGKHLLKDIKNKVKIISRATKVKIFLINKISLTQDVLPLFPSLIKTLKKENHDLLITSCSFSKSKKVIKELENYTERLSDLLKIKNKIFHFAGDETSVFKKIENSNINILLHPVFFFGGFLYQRNINRF